MILVAGSANLDFVVRAAHIPTPGETVLGRDFQTFPGGKGANQAVACARAGGAPTQMLLCLGNDPFAAPLEASLAAAGVQMHVHRCTAQATGTAFICVADSGENAITVAPGANAELGPEHLIPLSGFSHLLMQLETPLPTVLAYASAARLAGVRVVLNAAPAQVLTPDLLALIDMLVVNEGELRTLAGLSDASIAACLQRLGLPCVVVTLGHRGCLAWDVGQWHLQPAFPVNVVDTTAAGDTFCGALVAALSKGADTAQALRLAAAAGALACTQLGAQSSIPQADAVQQLASSPLDDASARDDLARYCGLS